MIEDIKKRMEGYGFNLSTGKTLKREKISLEEGKIYLHTMKDRRIKLFILLMDVPFSKVIYSSDVAREKRVINNKILPKLTYLSE